MSKKSLEDWEAQLVGKKFIRGNVSIAAEEQNKVAVHRVITPDSMVSMDFKPESIVTHVKFG
ncbi:12822_t:CDS:2 [Funneliformis geosporum]|nr:12822_t:CDS:2 [Funneliformis geosporum]